LSSNSNHVTLFDIITVRNYSGSSGIDFLTAGMVLATISRLVLKLYRHRWDVKSILRKSYSCLKWRNSAFFVVKMVARLVARGRCDRQTKSNTIQDSEHISFVRIDANPIRSPTWRVRRSLIQGRK
jgi:hypothetical protein